MAGSYKYETVESTVVAAVSEAIDGIGCLHEEMSDWVSNMEEKFSATARFEMSSEAAHALEQSIDAPDIPADLGVLKVKYGRSVPRSSKRSASRAVRLDNAISALTAAIEVLNEFFEKEENKDTEVDNSCVDELQSMLDNVDGIEFPGMFG